jgi:uncharacterized delta-60 repeat protein
MRVEIASKQRKHESNNTPPTAGRRPRTEGDARRDRTSVAAAGGGAVEGLEERRLYSAGDLDPTFSGDGLNRLAPGGSFDVVAMDYRGGRSVVLGIDRDPAQGTGTYGANLIAVRDNGTLDTSFSSDGIRPMPRLMSASDVFIQPDGKILVTGQFGSFLAVARLLKNGAADTSFGTDGFAQLRDFSSIGDVRVAPDGKIVVVGSSVFNFAAARLTANGVLDPTFGSTGSPGVARAILDGFATALAVQPDGKIVLVGQASDPTSIAKSDVGVARLTTAGQLDTSFAHQGFTTDGTYVFDVGDDDAGTSVDLTPDGRILVGAQLDGNRGGAIGLSPAGQLLFAVTDTYGGVGGAVGARVDAQPYDLRSSFDGSQFYLFVRQTGLAPSETTTAVVRYDADGTRDFAFGGAGGSLTIRGAVRADLTADGKIVTAGNPMVVDPATGAGSADYARVEVARRTTATVAADRVRVSGSTIYVEGTAAADTINITTNESTGVFTVVLNGQTKTFARTLNGADRNFFRIDAGAGNDTVRLTAVTSGGFGAIVYAGAGNDTITTAGGSDLIYAGAGDDLVNAMGGVDTILGGPGRDRLYGGDGNDQLAGSDFDMFDGVPDYLDGGLGNDRAFNVESGDALFSVESVG